MLREGTDNSQPIQEEDHRRSEASRRPTAQQLEDAEQHFSKPEHERFDGKFGGVDDGTERSQARREQAGQEVAQRKDRRANFVQKAVRVGKIAAVATVLAVGGEASGARQATTDAIQSVGSAAEPAVSGLASEIGEVITGDPDPLANYTGDDADKNIIAGNSSETAETVAPETTASAPVYDGVHVEDGPADTSLPTAPEDKEFGRQLAERNAQAEQEVADALGQSGGAPYQPETGGVEPQAR